MASTDPELAMANPVPHEQPPPYQAGYGSSDNVPPSLEHNHSDLPPSYESLYGNLKAAKQESSSFVDFLKKFLVIVLGTIGCTICIGIILAIPVSMIAIGSIYLDDCPAEKYIPIYLIVAGCFGVVKNLSNMVQRFKNKKENNDDENAKTNPFDGLLSCFLLAWFIAGNVWIYGLYNDWQDDDPDKNDYCNATLYWFAFWITTSTYIIGLVTCTCCCCIGGIMGLSGGDN